jgi:hypothetical protein
MFGTFHPPNISPDPDYGIGRWRIIDLANALISGVSLRASIIIRRCRMSITLT